jgi:hypothetical protein
VYLGFFTTASFATGKNSQLIVFALGNQTIGRSY